MTEEWRTDERPENTLQIGGISRVSQTHRQTGDTAHLLIFSDGRQIRVLPDGSSGQGRSRKVRAAMEAAEALKAESVDVMETYVVGLLLKADLTWEAVGNIREVTITEWLAAYFANGHSPDTGDTAQAEDFIEELAADGWEIVRAE